MLNAKLGTALGSIPALYHKNPHNHPYWILSLSPFDTRNKGLCKWFLKQLHQESTTAEHILIPFHGEN